MKNLALFDLDGTLINSKNLYFVGVPLTVKKFLNVEIEKKQFMDLWGQDVKKWFIRFVVEQGQYKESIVLDM